MPPRFLVCSCWFVNVLIMHVYNYLLCITCGQRSIFEDLFYMNKLLKLLKLFILIIKPTAMGEYSCIPESFFTQKE